MRTFQFKIPFAVPSKKNRYKLMYDPRFWQLARPLFDRFRAEHRHRAVWIDKDKAVKGAEQAIAMLAKVKLPKNLTTPVSVVLHVRQSKSRRRLQDIDNVVGAIFDGLVLSGRIPDDSPKYIEELHVYWRGRGPDEVVVKIIELS